MNEPRAFPVHQVTFAEPEDGSVLDCLKAAVLNHSAYQDVLILAYDHDGNLCVAHSNMTEPEKLWLLAKAQQTILE